MSVVGLVNKIIPFSSVDGPGNRTAIFLQGCNLNCQYCHNPETISLCISCGACVETCPTGALYWADGRENFHLVHHEDLKETEEKRKREGHVVFDPTKCVLCDTCLKTCPHNSSPRIRHMSSEEVMQVVEKQLPYIRGITISGGECTRQRDFLVDLFTLAKARGLHCLLDSNGTWDFKGDEELTALLDGVMLDIKAFTKEDHLQVTGNSNEVILRNAEYLASLGKLPEIRTVVVPGLFDYEETVRETVKLLRPYLSEGRIRYKLIKYRPMGVRKAYAVYQTPETAVMEYLKELAVSEGFDCVIT